MKMKRLFIMATLAVASMAGISVMAQAPAKEGACKTECVKSKGCCQADKECPAKADCPKAKGRCANTGKHGCQGNKPCPKK